jgi:hypothetical protein
VVQARQHEAGVGIFGTKAGMMTYFTPEGAAVPATVIALEEGNIVTMVKTKETDGYDAVQVGYKVVAEKKVKWPEMGHLKKSGCPPMKHLREFKVSAWLQPHCCCCCCCCQHSHSCCHCCWTTCSFYVHAVDFPSTYSMFCITALVCLAVKAALLVAHSPSATQ